MTVRLSPTLHLAAVAAALLSLVATPPAAAAKHEDGTQVEVTGLVTDAQGTPLPEVRVVLEASREVFSFRKFRRELRNTQRAAGLSGARADGPVVVSFADGARVCGQLDGDRLTLAAHRTAAGTDIPAKAWRVAFDGDAFRVTARG